MTNEDVCVLGSTSLIHGVSNEAEAMYADTLMARNQRREAILRHAIDKVNRWDAAF